MTRECGAYCFEHLEKLHNEGCISDRRYEELVAIKKFSDENSGIQGLSTESVLPLMREQDPEIQAEAIKKVGKAVCGG